MMAKRLALLHRRLHQQRSRFEHVTFRPVLQFAGILVAIIVTGAHSVNVLCNDSVITDLKF